MMCFSPWMKSSPSPQKHSVPPRNACVLLSAHLNLHSTLPIVNPREVKCVQMKTCIFIFSSLLLAKTIILPRTCAPYDGTVKAFLEMWIKINWDWARKQNGLCVILAGSQRTTQSFAFLKTQPSYGDMAQTTRAIWKLMNLSGKASFPHCNACHWRQPRWNFKWMQTQPLSRPNSGKTPQEFQVEIFVDPERLICCSSFREMSRYTSLRTRREWLCNTMRWCMWDPKRWLSEF